MYSLRLASVLLAACALSGVEPTEEAPAPSMTKEQKAIVMENFRQAQEQKKIDDLIRIAERNEKEAEELTKKEKALRGTRVNFSSYEQYNRDLDAFAKRADKLKEKADELTKVAKAKRDEAKALNDILHPPAPKPNTHP